MLLLITWSWVLLSVPILNRTWLPYATKGCGICDVKVCVQCQDSKKRNKEGAWGQALSRAAGTAHMSSVPSSH